MRPPSSPSDAALSPEWLQAMLDVEAALARALARAGLIGAGDAETIAAACLLDRVDTRAIAEDAAASGNPVVPLVRALTAAVPEPARGHVHRGATSQDVLDSAAMLMAHRALGPLLDDLRASATAAAALARAHRETPIAGRTLLQQALPITFGLKAAGWAVALDDAVARLGEVRGTRLAVQLGGAAGSLATLGAAGPAVLEHLAGELGLATPVLPWHTNRTRVVELACALGEAAAVAGKVARDVVLLAQTEVAEVREGVAGRGGSSTLPHKRNPVAAVSAIACAAGTPGLVATLLTVAAQHEHERAAGAWQAEWRPLGELLATTGAAAGWLRDCLEHLEVDAAQMRANLDRTGGLLLAERVATELAPQLGRLRAHDLVRDAAHQDRPFAEALASLLDPDRVAELLDPTAGLETAVALVDRALEGRDD